MTNRYIWGHFVEKSYVHDWKNVSMEKIMVFKAITGSAICLGD